jgi:Zn-dependent protease
VFGSFRIGSVFGITVRVHWLFLALMVLVPFLPAGGVGPLEKLSLLLLLFGVVFLHELGHSLVARRFGIRVYDITFWPLGGMARMSEIPERPKTEILIASAGPAVNFALAALALPLALWSQSALDEPVSNGMQFLASTSGYFVAVNLLLGVFNLVPAFPMDGGRVLRALLGISGDWVAATEKAVKIGRLLAFAMIAAGLIWSQLLPVLPLIGLFVWFTGARELWAVRARHGRIPFGQMAGQPMPGSTAAWSAPPPPTRGAPPPETDPSGARRPEPGAAAIVSPTAALRRPLTDDDIERLERFRGPLRQFRQDA